MSSLKENQCYGLSSDQHQANVSVFHVKLTDSAARAIGGFQSGKGRTSNPTICFGDNEGKITIPCSDGQDKVSVFTITLNNVSSHNPHGRFECVQQTNTRAVEELSCLGVIQKKMTVNATDDSYDKAKQSMAQAEEETRSRAAIVIKHGAVSRQHKEGGGKSKVKKTTGPLGPNSAGNEVQSRQLRERVTHLLALKPYKKPELLLRLQRDGLKAAEKEELDTMLQEVGQLSSKDGAFVLKDSLYKELQKDWPGYTSGDQQLLKRILVRRLFQPQQNLLSVPEAQVSPLRDTPNSSPAHRPKHSLHEEYTDPLVNKRPRISRMSAKTDTSTPRPAEQAAQRDKEGQKLDPRKLLQSLSEAEAAKRLEPPRGGEELTRGARENDKKTKCDQPPAPLVVPDLNRPKVTRRKSRHKHKEKVTTLYQTRLRPKCDVFRKYTSISTSQQRQSFKLDFNREYSEYRDLHARIDCVTRQFMELDSQLKQLQHDSQKYKTVHNQIVQEYREIKKSNPNYSQDKIRCEYLHNKLAHIKKLISEYDQQHWHKY
uniref:OCEL domain-containing protein n=1 Tax=Neogobius melanostomus TaxID=47308 RepID=A0A8C6TUA4_9GOBI